MAKRRKRRYSDDSEEPEYRQDRRRKRRGRRSSAGDADGGVAVADKLPERPKPPVTCYQCSHLVVTRSFVKHVSQSWDRAIVYPTLSCFQQCWTLEDPDSVDEYLVANADRCPSYVRGYPRNHDW
jgi:hypothetical protein